MSVINKNIRILIAEDNKTNQLYLSALLDFMNIFHKIANNGKEAVEALENEQFDCILMDIFMPVMDGIEATEIIRATEQQKSIASIPIIAVTASSNNEDWERCISVGMNAFVTKPINETQLFELINQFCQKEEN